MSTEPEPVTTQGANLPAAEPQEKESQAENGAVAHDPTPQKTTAPLGEDKPRLKEVTQLIADQLGEQELGPWQTIHRSVRVVGVERALALLQRALALEEAGGMMLPDESRRRTLGGVYFWLLRQEGSAEERRRIFQVMGSPKPKRAGTPDVPPEQHKQKQPEKRSQLQPAIPWTWAERGPVLDETEAERGEARTVKVTLIGRPEKLVERGKSRGIEHAASSQNPVIACRTPAALGGAGGSHPL